MTDLPRVHVHLEIAESRPIVRATPTFSSRGEHLDVRHALPRGTFLPLSGRHLATCTRCSGAPLSAWYTFPSGAETGFMS